MTVEAGNFSKTRREWVAITSTFITASTASLLDYSDQNSKFVSLGSRLVADLADEIGFYWQVTNGVVDGEALPPTFNYVQHEHWVLLPPDDDVQAKDALTEERLTGAAWSFGLTNRELFSIDFHFLPDGKIGGYRHVNESSWTLDRGEVQIFSMDGPITWKFDIVLLESGRLKLFGFTQDEVWHDSAVLTELPPITASEKSQIGSKSGSSVAADRREWISITPTFVSALSSHGLEPFDQYNSFVPLQSHLVATLSETGEGHWIIDDGELNGERLPQHLRLVHQEHWVILPSGDDQPVSALLTEERLTGCRWSFGLSNRDLMSTAFYFAPDGRIAGYKHFNETFWKLQDAQLFILTGDGLVTWKFDIAVLQNNLVKIFGFTQNEHWFECAILTEMPVTSKAADPSETLDQHAASTADDLAPEDSIKMIVWDLDQTFWKGSLAEGDAKPIHSNIEFVKSMAGRGIINSICARSDFDQVKEELIKLDIWHYFVFPKIDFSPKGAMIQEIIQAARLRSQSVMLIDDNTVDIREARYYCPGIQVCTPEDIAGLLDDPRCKGSPDRDLMQLEWYKVLEKKTAEYEETDLDDLDFLKRSKICLSLHHDILSEFPQVHALVNQTNQLNFTKNRWPREADKAREVFNEELGSQVYGHCGYVRVSDKYGSYGICGFYLVRDGKCRHFLFSSRIMNMGVEALVWKEIGWPGIDGETISMNDESQQWIEVVENADIRPS